MLSVLIKNPWPAECVLGTRGGLQALGMGPGDGGGEADAVFKGGRVPHSLPGRKYPQFHVIDTGCQGQIHLLEVELDK